MNLTTRFVNTVKQPGMYSDSRRTGLMLRVNHKDSKSWVQQIWIKSPHGNHRRRIRLGLGSTRFISLQEARDIAYENQKLARTGQWQDRENKKTITFKEAAELVIADHSEKWKGDGTAKSWQSTLATYVYPKLGSMDVIAIQSSDIRRIIKALWNSKYETARKVLRRINTVFEYCIGESYIEKNPCENATKGLSKEQDDPSNHRALPYSEVGNAIRKLRDADIFEGIKDVLEFIALTGCRSQEACKAEWDHMDMKGKTWNMPSTLTKTKEPHCIPLSKRALEILKTRKAASTGDLVFPSARGKAFTATALKRAWDGCDIATTTHGLRAAFRTWGAETGQNAEAMEIALSHKTKGKVKGAYQRGDIFEIRKGIMQQWCDYLSK
ncbi:MAG: tyrosine-type recombinase/integrase [Gammaproteobacteria bacterium]|nr:tyrosine-type recombinase/integrase [Gammaproteobacteria bacterium]